MKMSHHCQEDRLDRMVYIATTIGWGEIIIEHERDGRRECLTSTGVILIKDLKKDFLITAYIASIDRAVAICHSVYGKDGKLPSSVYKTVCQNTKKKRHFAQNA